MYRIIFFICMIFSGIYNAQNLNLLADSLMLKNEIPEMTFAIVSKDKILLKSTRGHHKITEIKEKATASSRDFLHLGSNTKAITGFISAYLVEKAKRTWHTLFFDLFPELKEKSNPKYHEINLEDLLSHRALVQPFTSGQEYQKLPNFAGDKQSKRSEFVKYILSLEPVNNQKIYNYSNAGYSAAAMMLEKVSGKSWEKLVLDVMKSELKLEVYFGWPIRNLANQPFGHWLENGKLVALEANTAYNLNLAEPAGDLSMNIDDYAKFIQLNLAGLSGENNILKAETYHYLHTIKSDYAIGWANYQKNNSEISEHAGSDGTFYSYTQIDRKKLMAYIVIINTGAPKAQKAVMKMIEAMKSKHHD